MASGKWWTFQTSDVLTDSKQCYFLLVSDHISFFY